MGDNMLLLMLVGGIAGALIIGGIFIGSIPMAALVFVWKNVFPVVKRLAKWSARPENMVSMLLLALIPFVLILVLTFTFTPLFIIFIPIPLILFIPPDLGIMVWLIRGVKTLYNRWRVWLIVMYLRRQMNASSRQPIRIRRSK
jgi:hypothetical protein